VSRRAASTDRFIQRWIEQLLVGRQDYDEREWDNSAQQESANEPPERRSRKPRRHRSKETHGCQGRLNHSGSAGIQPQLFLYRIPFLLDVRQD
jgi:hypothetical protein